MSAFFPTLLNRFVFENGTFSAKTLSHIFIQNILSASLFDFFEE